MRYLKLTLLRPGTHPPVDLAIAVEPGVTVAALAEALGDRDPAVAGRSTGPDSPAWTDHAWTDKRNRRPRGLTLALHSSAGARPVTAESTLEKSGIASGATVVLVQDPGRAEPAERRREAAVLEVVAGLDAPRRFRLHSGRNEVGRDPACDVVLSDPLVSKRHAVIHVTDVIDIVDSNSSNGVWVGGGPVTRARLGPEDIAEIGDTAIRVVPGKAAGLDGSGKRRPTGLLQRFGTQFGHGLGPFAATPPR